MSRHFKVHELLNESELEEFRAYSREPGRTIDELHLWLTEWSIKNDKPPISRGAVGNWKQAFDEELIAERMNSSGGFARAMIEAAKESGGLALPDAAIMATTKKIFDRMLTVGDSEDDAATINASTLGLQRLMLAKSRLEATRTEFEDRERRALDEARKIAAGGGSGDAVADKVAELLGVK